jgi:hypothetical protein
LSIGFCELPAGLVVDPRRWVVGLGGMQEIVIVSGVVL